MQYSHKHLSVCLSGRLDKCTKFPIQMETTCLCNSVEHCSRCAFVRDSEMPKTEWQTLNKEDITSDELHQSFVRSMLSSDLERLHELLLHFGWSFSQLAIDNAETIEISYAFNQTHGNSSYGLTLLDGFGEEHTQIMNNVYVGLNDIFSGPLHFYITMQAVYAAAVDFIFLGAQTVLPHRRDAMDRELSLRHLTRISCLQYRKNCPGGQVCRELEGYNYAEFQHLYLFPAASQHACGQTYADPDLKLYDSEAITTMEVATFTDEGETPNERKEAGDSLHQRFPSDAYRPDHRHASAIDFLTYGLSLVNTDESPLPAEHFETQSVRRDRLLKKIMEEDLAMSPYVTSESETDTGGEDDEEHMSVDDNDKTEEEEMSTDVPHKMNQSTQSADNNVAEHGQSRQMAQEHMAGKDTTVKHDKETQTEGVIQRDQFTQTNNDEILEPGNWKLKKDTPFNEAKNLILHEKETQTGVIPDIFQWCCIEECVKPHIGCNVEQCMKKHVQECLKPHFGYASDGKDYWDPEIWDLEYTIWANPYEHPENINKD